MTWEDLEYTIEDFLAHQGVGGDYDIEEFRTHLSDIVERRCRIRWEQFLEWAGDYDDV